MEVVTFQPLFFCNELERKGMTELTTAQILGIINDFMSFIPSWYPQSIDIFSLLKDTGCRIQEATDPIRWRRLGSDYALKPLKGNDIRTFSTAELSQNTIVYLNNFPNYPQEIPMRKYQQQFDYFKGNVTILRGQKEISTHLFRHNYARQLRVNGLTDVQVQNKLGERTLSSALEYLDTKIFSDYY